MAEILLLKMESLQHKFEVIYALAIDWHVCPARAALKLKVRNKTDTDVTQRDWKQGSVGDCSAFFFLIFIFVHSFRVGFNRLAKYELRVVGPIPFFCIGIWREGKDFFLFCFYLSLSFFSNGWRFWSFFFPLCTFPLVFACL